MPSRRSISVEDTSIKAVRQKKKNPSQILVRRQFFLLKIKQAVFFRTAADGVQELPGCQAIKAMVLAWTHAVSENAAPIGCKSTQG